VANLKSHGKIMLVDDRLVAIGGLALAALSLDFRREVAIIVEESDLHQLFGTVAASAAADRTDATHASMLRPLIALIPAFPGRGGAHVRGWLQR
jgi:phosphatidylserine/phosphatidylglycerophosphate/cardiolipin synthase-like enzyme